jgi:LicD family
LSSGYLTDDKKYPDIARACIMKERAPKYFTDWEILDAEKAEYYDKYPYIDLYHTKEPTVDARKGNGQVRVVWGPGCTFDAKTVFPLQKVPFYGKTVFAPNNTTKYLSQLYGPGFMKPPPQKLRNGHGYYNNACKAEWQKS